jgi:hypothetical protein
VKRLWMAIPSHADQLNTSFSDAVRSDRLTSDEGDIEVRITALNLPILISALANGDSKLGRGARGAIPLQLELQSRHIILDRDHPLRWRIEVAAQKSGP